MSRNTRWFFWVLRPALAWLGGLAGVILPALFFLSGAVTEANVAYHNGSPLTLAGYSMAPEKGLLVVTGVGIALALWFTLSVLYLLLFGGIFTTLLTFFKRLGTWRELKHEDFRFIEEPYWDATERVMMFFAKDRHGNYIHLARYSRP